MNNSDKNEYNKIAEKNKDSDFEFHDPNEGTSPARVSENALTNQTEAFTFETDEEETIKQRKRRRKKKPQPYLLVFSLVVATLYIIGALLYVNNLQNKAINELDVFTMIVTLLGPAALTVLAGFLGESISKANRDSRTLTFYAKRILEPEKSLSDGVKSRLSSVREEIEKLEITINAATNRLAGLEENIRTKNLQLREVTNEARGGADQLVNTMEAERNRLSSILNGLAELNKSAQNSARQATIGLDEKTALLTKAAEALTETSTNAANAAENAAQRLDGAVDKAIGAASSLDEASVRGEQAIGRAHDLMVMARVSADKAIGGVSNAIDYLNDAANNAAETAKQVSQLVAKENKNTLHDSEAMIENVRRIAEESAKHIVSLMEAEAQNASLKAKESVQAFEETAGSVKKLTEEAGNLIAAQLQANKHRIDNLRQQSFELSQEADSFAQSRLNSAKDLIEQSSGLLNDAGEKINSRFNDVANVCIEQAKSIEAIIDGLNHKLDSLPQEAQNRANMVEALLNETLAKLNDAGKQAAEEAKGLNENFQNRLQESYSALGEVAQRLAAISGIGIVQPPISAPINKPIPEAPKPNIATENNNDIMPDPRSVIGRPIHHDAQTSPISENKTQTSDLNDAENKASINKNTSFGSILSPNIPVRSTPIQNTPMPVEQKIDKLEEPPKPTFVLRGRTSNIDDEIVSINNDKKDAFKDAVLKPNKPEELPIEVNLHSDAQNTNAPTKPISTAIETQETNSPTSITLNHDIDRDWSWREVLLSSGAQKQTTEDKIKSDILNEFALDRILNDVTLERYLQAYSRNAMKAKDLTKSNLPMQISGLQRKIAENLELRPFLARFVDERRELVKLGRLRGNDLRIYLLAEASLD
ncbi:MAG: hypothetical protein LCH83_10320 [Proteobacteria bacterium]|nr:hypothetical protein [Pseudomonadota bacterium]